MGHTIDTLTIKRYNYIKELEGGAYRWQFLLLGELVLLVVN